MEKYKRVPRSVRLSPEMEEEIKRRADENGNRTTFAQWVRNAIERALEERP